MIDPKKKRGLHIPLQVWLCYLLVATMLCTGVTFAKYTSTASGSDSARVAKWGVVVAPVADDTTVTINEENESTEDQSRSYEFTVTSEAEVSLEYKLEVVFPEALPTGLSIQMDDKDATATSADKTTFTFAGGTIAAGDSDKTREHTLTVTAKLGTAADGALAADFLNKNVTINVIAEQID